jgi:hypothetical protein
MVLQTKKCNVLQRFKFITKDTVETASLFIHKDCYNVTRKSSMLEKVEEDVNYGKFYSVFHHFGQTKFAFGCLILSMSQFLLLPQSPLKTMLAIEVVKTDSNNIISLL